VFGHGTTCLIAVFMEGSLRQSACPSIRRFQGARRFGNAFQFEGPRAQKVVQGSGLIFSRQPAPKKTVKISAFLSTKFIM
jgi:hypothetical protein